MEIKEHYFEVCNIINDLFVELFKHLNENCKEELETINQQYPFEPLKYQDRILMLQYEEGIQLLKEVGTKVKPMGGLTSEHEKKLGRLIREKCDTDLFILYRHPLAVRPLYSMPCVENPSYSNCFDVFIRGEQVISGSQRIHEYELLMKRAAEFGFELNHITDYLGLLRYGSPPRGGFGAGLERIVMLYCGLSNIRLASLFPRDPQRLKP
ncbi:Aspartyl-tRNA synthetase, cytoplasmic [Panicum miliaceum]|uniref:aspartate--tRNA ligase n=1 Tax=Panicum miliaceum TaxID=4540 RepID=A0A3L6SP19_PANMI|nr:Aspartyl-tRNA synthetase, cytoplasmic [Panicum miliaceum]